MLLTEKQCRLMSFPFIRNTSSNLGSESEPPEPDWLTRLCLATAAHFMLFALQVKGDV
jgi:hypothetical protein